MRKEGRQTLDLEGYVQTLAEAIIVTTHRHRERFLWWVLCPIFLASFWVSLFLMVLDAMGRISPMRSGLLTTFTVLATGGVVSSGAAAGFSLLGQKDSE